MNVRPYLGLRILAASVLLLLPNPGRAAGPPSIRVAIGPFFAPTAQDDLRRAAQSLPELLTVELSHLGRFQLVEREKIDSVWSELRLDSAGLVSKDNVARLGQMLACDWVVSGTLVQADRKTFLWTKVIDARAGVVLDLQATAFHAAVVTNVALQIASFVDKAGQSHAGRQFVAMGPMIDISPDAVGREDWSRRVVTLLEKRFLERGLGVAELAAVGPIFEERRLQNAGLTGHPESRVELQSAFWLIDGGCEWVDEREPGRVAVGLRIQRVGGPPQTLWVTNTPTAALENDVMSAVLHAMASTNGLATPSPSSDAEADLLVARGRELAERRLPFRAREREHLGSTQWDQYKRMQAQAKRMSENRRALMANYERLALKDPGNMEAKTMLAYCWIGESDPALQQRALEMFKEVAANTADAVWAAKAHRTLTNTAMLEQMRGMAGRGTVRPKDWHSLNMAYQEAPDDPETQCDLGEALIHLPRAHDRQRGREMLTKVAAGGHAVQADRARRLLAESPGTAAIVEPAGR